MKTTMPTSTISYNSGGFLKLKLDELLKAEVIQFYAFIEHVPEEDEKKKHKHLYIEPAKSVQTEELRDELREYVEETPDKPLGCMPFGKSKFGDWYLYAIHDEAYLSSKGQTRKFHYRRDMFITSDDDYFDELVRNIDMLKITPYQKLAESIKHGDSFGDVIRRGQVPINQLANWHTAWQVLAGGDVLNRNNRNNHEDNEYNDDED